MKQVIVSLKGRHKGIKGVFSALKQDGVYVVFRFRPEAPYMTSYPMACVFRKHRGYYYA